MHVVNLLGRLRFAQSNSASIFVNTCLVVAFVLLGLNPAYATNFTRSVPGTSLQLPAEYPEAGGVALVMVGVNGNAYFQFSDPNNAFRGFNNNANRNELEGNPFTINDPIALDCGFSSCRDYFGGGLANLYIRFSAYDGDTQPQAEQNQGFDFNDISLLINGFNVGNWSDVTTQITNDNGTSSSGFRQGFGNNTFNTGWFQSTDQGLLNNLLDTGISTTQVLDDDPNDNYWDFQRGPSLGNPDIVTVAPGYTIEKSASTSNFTTVGQQITYTYIVSNVGSVPISNIQIQDDQINAQGGSVSCDKTTLQDRPQGDPAGPDQATCTGVYTITQADLDVGEVVNVATASGTPSEGQLGAVSDTATVTGPTQTPSIEIEKTSSLSNFGSAGSAVPYSFRVENTGNVTLTNVRVTDTRIPSLSCDFATLNVDQVQTCSGSYTVTQADVDAFAASATQLSNTATVTADAPNGPSLSEDDTLNIPGSAANPSISLNKVSLTPTFNAPGDAVDYRFDIQNTGNVTLSPATASVWPPVVNDSLGVTVTCPATAIAPGQTLSCSGSYTVQQSDIDAGEIINTASTSFTVNGQNVSDNDQATVPATRTTGIQMVKRLAAGSLSTYTTVGQTISYEYEIRNTGSVTLNDARVEDDKATVSCPATPIAPNATLICTASYVVDQDDLNDGSVTNLATGFATPTNDPEIQSSQQDLTVNAQQTRSLEVAKSAGTPTPSFSVGSTITYTFDVTNTGNVDLDGPFTVSDNRIGNFQCFTGTLLTGAGNAQSCTADYTLTANDVGAGFVTNTASVSGDGVTSPSDSATVANTASPSVALSKSASPSPVPTGTTSVTYTFTVLNDGTAQLVKSSSPITINDPLIGAVDCATPQPATLDPGNSFDCTATYTLQQSEIDAGEVVNTATASFPFNTPSGTQTITSPSATATTPIEEDPSFVFNKSVAPNFTSVGENLTYTFSVTNDGNVTLTSVDITDPNIPSLSCSISNLAPTATDTCTGTYIVTQADVDAGTIGNTASATGQTQQGTQVTESDTANTNRTPTANDSQFTVEKSASLPAYATVGQDISYAIDVRNTGLQTVEDITVTDILDPSFTCTISSIAPGQGNDQCSFVYRVTQDDIDAGTITNTASAVNADFGPESDTLILNGPVQTASFTTTKTALNAFTVAGDTVTYRVSVENTGNVRINTVSVADRGQTCNIGTIDPGVIDTSCEFTFTVTQADVDAGEIVNTATTTGTGAEGTALTSPAPATANGPAEMASLTVLKVEDDGTGDFGTLPTSEDYTITVQNTGNVTVNNISVTDDLIGLSCVINTILPGDIATSCDPTDSTLMAGTYTVTQSDIDTGSLNNTVQVSGTTPEGTTVEDETEIALDGPTQTRALETVKTFNIPTGTIISVGQSIDYNYEVFNRGNVTHTSPISVTDDRISSVSCPTLPVTGLAPDASVICTGTYSVTQADLDNGTITNIASATSTLGDGTVVTSPTDSATVTLTQNPALTIDKRLKSTSAGTYSSTTDTVTYEYVVTNSGNTTITDTVRIDDDRFPADLVCTTSDIAPMGQVICEQTYAIDQNDLNTGSVTNTAQAFTGPTLAGATIASNTDQVTVTAMQDPVLFIDKNIVLDGTETFTAGQNLDYTYLVRNDGNVAITINPANVVQDNRTTVDCSGAPATLNPGESFTCTSVGTVLADDISIGALSNTAFAQGTFDGDPITSPTDLQTFPVDADPALGIAKATTTTTFTAVGDPIVYTYEVTNTGNTDLAEPLVVNDDKIVGPVPNCDDPDGGLFVRIAVDPTEIATCTATYLVTQADLDAGFVTNVVIANTTFGSLPIPVVSEPATVTVNGNVTAELDLTKTVSPATPPMVGDVLTYTLTASASGNQTISGAEISDPLIPTLTCTQSGGAVTIADLDPNGDPLICTGTVTVTQQMIDDGSVDNTASVRGSAPDGTVIMDDATRNLTAEAPMPELTVTKTVNPVPATGADPAYATIDQTVQFIITVENTGNVTVDGVTITDTPTSSNAPTLAGCTVGTLAPGDTSSTCVVEIVTTQAEVDAGSFDNTATATGTPANGGTVTGSDTINVLGPEREREFAMEKVANTTLFDSIGDVITYTYTIANIGNVTLTDQPVVVDDKIGTFNCGTLPAGGLLPTDTISCTANYTVTQDDVDAGFVTNLASVTSDEVPTPATATETVNADQAPDLSFTKTPSITSDAAAGDTITYTYAVTNTGNTRLFDVTVTDTQTSSAGTTVLVIAGDSLTDNLTTGDSSDGQPAGIWGTLAPGDVATFTASYTVTQDDIDDGGDLSNTANVTSSSPPGTTPPTGTQTVTVPVEPKNGELTVEKTITNSTGINAGDTVTFRVEVDNSGNLTLDLPVLTDTLTRLDGTLVMPAPTLSAPTGNTSDLTHLNVEETFVYTFIHTLTQADVDAGGISNSVLARADDPDGNQVLDISGNGQPGGDNQSTVLQIPAMPAISAEKTITSSTTAVDETVVFEITVTNDGNVTLNPVTVSDTLERADGTTLTLQSGPTFTSASNGSSAGTLLPDETATYVASYKLVQADIDAGGISNQATAFGTPPVGGPVSDDSDNGDDADGNTANDPTTLDIAPEPELSVLKRLAASESGNFDTLNQQISYEFVVTNEGNITLSGPFTVADAKIEGSNDDLSCPAGPLAPDESLICTGTYSVTQDDLDLGSLTNAATVSDGTTTSPSDDLTIPAIQNRSIAVVKEAQDFPTEDFDVGFEVTYTYTVNNDGNVTIEDDITINDNLIPNAPCEALPSGGLIPGASIECEGIYTVTADDVDLGEVTNVASGTDGTATSPLVSETIPDTSEPSLSIVKTADANSTFSDVGDTLTYTFEITNTGTRNFVNDIRVFDTKIGDESGLVCFTPNPSFSTGQTVSCEFDYTVTQEDLDAGEVVNEAYAQTTFGDDDMEVSSAPTSETVEADLDPMMSLTKTSSPNPAGPVGSTVTYTFIATNTGNQTLNTVKVTDPRIPSLDCEVTELLRDDVLTCSADYTVTQDDIDAGTLVNTASVDAMTPSGASTPTTTATETTDVPASVPEISVDKIPSQTVFGEAGTFVTFLFDVRNLGNTTLSNITIDDVLDTGAPCVIPTLAPGGIDNFSCTFMLEVTQDMVDNATVTNSVTVTATDPFGTDVTDTDSETLDGPPRIPALETTKVVLSGDQTLFSPITYALQVENTGNVTLSAPVITDTMTRIANGASVNLNMPFALDSGDTNGNGLLDVGETFLYLAMRNLTQGDINAGGLINTASATADGPSGTGSATDVSDNGDDTDGNTADDPTVFEITSEPEITTIKSVVSNTGNSAGDTVIFSIVARNTGNVDVSGVTITDTLTRADGAPLSSPPVTNVSGSTTLDVGEEIEWTVEYVLTQDDVNAGGLANSANVSGLAPDGGIVSDTSSDNDPFDGNNDDDTTPFNIVPEPSLDLVKVQTEQTVVPGEQIGFSITSTNDGNVTLTNLVLVDTLSRADGTPLSVDSVVYEGADQGSAEGTLAPGESSTHTVLYTIVQGDIDAGGVSNTATLTGTAPNGASIMDRSRDDDPNDGNNTDDPTFVLLVPTQSTSLIKSVSEPVALFPQVYQVTFTLEVKNDGNLTTTGLQVFDDLTDFQGTADIVREDPFVFSTSAPGLTLNPDYDGETDTALLDGSDTLAAGETKTIEIQLVYSLEFGGATAGNIFSTASDQQTDPTVSNEVTINTGDADGDGIPDDLEACGAADRDNDGICDAEDFDPTGYFYCEDNGQILAGGQISVQGPLGTQVGVGTSNNITIVRDGADGQFVFFVSRPGTYRLLASYPPGSQPSTSRLTSGTIDATSLLPANPASLGSGEFGATRVLGDFTEGANTFYTTFVFEAGDPFIINNNLPLRNCANTAGIFASKTADRASAVFGETVNFTLNFVNNTDTAVTDVTFTDLLPAGMLYTPGSAQVNGALLEPTVTGLRLDWPGQTLAANNTTRVTLAARVVANGTYGELVNRAYVSDNAGGILSNIATATVRVEPEHVFDCSDIIGKVFDDKNGNGYQDGPILGGITNQDYNGGKGSVAEVIREGEPGLPGVRLATVNGVLITTDKHGRYHVPCAELPKEIGSNFLLKLDTRTLPTGYRVTTENPRVVRVTAGKFAKLNFGASLSNVVDIDLTGAAFTTDNAPTDKLVKGVEHLISRIQSTPSVLRISYILRGEDRKVANARLKAVEKLVRDRWRGAGRYKLNVERSIKRVQ